MRFAFKRWIVKGLVLALVAGIITFIFEIPLILLGAGSLLVSGEGSDSFVLLKCILFPLFLAIEFTVLGAVCEWVNKMAWINRM